MHVGPSRKSLTRILLWAAPLTWLGCGGGGSTDIALPSLTITTSTDGVELDADGYSVAVDGGSPQAIGLDATVTVDPLSGWPAYRGAVGGSGKLFGDQQSPHRDGECGRDNRGRLFDYVWT